MLSKQEKEKRQEAVMLIMDDMIPEDHILKQIDKYGHYIVSTQQC